MYICIYIIYIHHRYMCLCVYIYIIYTYTYIHIYIYIICIYTLGIDIHQAKIIDGILLFVKYRKILLRKTVSLHGCSRINKSLIWRSLVLFQHQKPKTTM